MRPNREEVQRREDAAWALRQEGRTEAAIAAELGITKGAVSKILDRVSRAARRRLTEEAALQKVVQLGQLEHIVEEAMLAWERSKADAVAVKAIEGQPAERTTRTQVGNPAFLARAMDAMASIREILGIDAPAAVDHDGEVKIVVEYVDHAKDHGERHAPLGLLGT